jgi:transcriptional regulator with XRE-family HTH domain
MSDFNDFVKEQLKQPEVAREYYRLAPYFRLAEELTVLRKKRGLTQQELAEKAQTTQAVISRLENVTVHCSLESVIRFAESLDSVVELHLIPIEELFAEEEKEKDEAPCLEDTKKGVVYFNPPAQKPCPDTVWASFNPLTGEIIKPGEKRKQKVVEIA